MFLVTIYEPSLLMSQVYIKDEQNVKLLATIVRDIIPFQKFKTP